MMSWSHSKYECLDCNCCVIHIREWYMLVNQIWNEAVYPDSCQSILCVSCLEIRLGRELTATDFSPQIINTDHNKYPKSERLLSRIRRRT